MMTDSNNTFNRLFAENKRLIIIFLLLVSCILVVSSIFFILSIAKPNKGVTLSSTDGYWTVERVTPNSIASQAGILEGDHPVWIDGQPAETFLARYREYNLVFGTQFTDLTVIDSNGRLKSVSLEEGQISGPALTQQITWLLISIIFWIVGFYVFLKRPRNVTSLLLCLIGVLFGLMLSSNMAWGVGISAAEYFEILATTIGPWLLLHFFLILPEERKWLRSQPLLYAIYLPVAVTLVFSCFMGNPLSQSVLWFQNMRYLEAGIGLLAATGVVFFNYFCAASTKARQQMKIVLFSCFASFIPFSVLNLFPKAIWGQNILPPEYSILFLAFIPIGMGHAVVTQKLMDIDFILRRGVIYGFITIIMSIILTAGIFPAVLLNESLSMPEQIIITLLLGALATVLFGPLKNIMEKMVDKFLYKDRYDYRQIIQSLSTSLNSVDDINSISRLIVGAIVNTLNLEGCCLCIEAQSSSFEIRAAQGTFTEASKQQQLLTLLPDHDLTIAFPDPVSTDCPELAFVIPLLLGDREIGIICLSRKVSKQDFSSNDKYLLQGIASVAVIALHSAILTRDVSLRDTFISVASHELRIPLTSIVGYADLLLHRDPTDVKKRQWLKNILDNGQRISAMVDDLLNVSLIQSRKINIKLERVELYDILEETLSLSKESTTKHEFIIDVEPNLPDVLVDRNKFVQVIENLLSNAVKYSPNGGRITLSAHNHLSKHSIRVSLADEGIGIGPEDQESLFKTFHRVLRPETRGIRGSGLGLYIAKEWIEAMGGKIWLRSELNKGSTFFIAIPIQMF